MINPISSTADVYNPSLAASPAQTAPKQTATPQDSVHLSPQAQAAASGDVDHDGDSH